MSLCPTTKTAERLTDNGDLVCAQNTLPQQGSAAGAATTRDAAAVVQSVNAGTQAETLGVQVGMELVDVQVLLAHSTAAAASFSSLPAAVDGKHILTRHAAVYIYGCCCVGALV